MSRDIFHQPRLFRAPSSLALNTAREGAATASLGNLCQCYTTLMVKKLYQWGENQFGWDSEDAVGRVNQGARKRHLGSTAVSADQKDISKGPSAPCMW